MRFDKVAVCFFQLIETILYQKTSFVFSQSMHTLTLNSPSNYLCKQRNIEHDFILIKKYFDLRVTLGNKKDLKFGKE